MPISPQEARNRFMETIESEKRRVYDEIDQAIIDHCGNRFTYSAKLIPDKLREFVVQDYRKAGWDVTYTGDSRDGHFYEFKPLSTTNYWDK
jgi:hypothetical protein